MAGENATVGCMMNPRNSSVEIKGDLIDSILVIDTYLKLLPDHGRDVAFETKFRPHVAEAMRRIKEIAESL